jgi:hypothetical protein
MLQLQNEIRLGGSRRSLAEITAVEIMSGMPTLFGQEFTFVFRVEPFDYEQNPPTLTDLKITISLVENNQSLMIGRFTSRSGSPDLLNSKNRDIQLQLYLRTDELIVLADRTHHGDVTFEFNVVARFGDDIYPSSKGSLVVPHSKWLEILNRLQLDRYELIVIRTPVAASHLHSPFSEALNKIREAEREFTKGNWNGTGAACRSAWNTVLSSVPKGTPRDQRLEHLLTNVTGDPRRQKFAFAVLKGFNNVINEAVHLEGDIKSSRAPADLTRDDALLCLHWYSAAIAYLASVANPPVATTS